MDRDTTQHPAPNTDGVNVTWDSLTDEQRAALTPEQRERLTSGVPLPIDPRSPMLDQADKIATGDAVVEGREQTTDPEVIPADQLTMGGAPVDPDAGGDYDGDGRVEHVAEHEIVDAGTPIADQVERDRADDVESDYR